MIDINVVFLLHMFFDSGYRKYSFNQLVSDRLGFRRNIPDLRNERSVVVAYLITYLLNYLHTYLLIVDLFGSWLLSVSTFIFTYNCLNTPH